MYRKNSACFVTVFVYLISVSLLCLLRVYVRFHGNKLQLSTMGVILRIRDMMAHYVYAVSVRRSSGNLLPLTCILNDLTLTLTQF